jgi:integrase
LRIGLATSSIITPGTILSKRNWRAAVARRCAAGSQCSARRCAEHCSSAASRFANSICRRPAKAAPFFLEENAADELHACYAPHARPIISMLRFQGCRVAEALRLKLPGDISFRRETITFRDTKNGDPRRIVPMHERTAETLRAYLGECEVGPVFLTPAGEAYNDRRLAAQGIGYDGGGIRTA